MKTLTIMASLVLCILGANSMAAEERTDDVQYGVNTGDQRATHRYKTHDQRMQRNTARSTRDPVNTDTDTNQLIIRHYDANEIRD